MTWPKITVVTPSFNQGRFLEETLRSVHDQGYPNLEHIVMDGGSTDGSVEIIRRYASRLAYWVSEPDGGQTAALINGFRRATGDVLCWLNSDDLFEPWTLREVAGFFRGCPDAHVVYGDATWIDAAGRVLRPKREHAWSRFIWMYDHNFISQPSTFWRRGVYEQVGGLDARWNFAMDGDLWIRFAEVAPLRHVRRLWSRERIYLDAKSQRYRAQCAAEDALIRRRYLARETDWTHRPKRLAARGIRVAWKLASGCYTHTP
jgi:glycosyltransferase involved in cell wall biosynthesis